MKYLRTRSEAPDLILRLVRLRPDVPDHYIVPGISLHAHKDRIADPVMHQRFSERGIDRDQIAQGIPADRQTSTVLLTDTSPSAAVSSTISAVRIILSR